MVDTYTITPGSCSVEGNIIGDLGTLNDLDIFSNSETELLTENQRLVNTSLNGISACSSGGCDEEGNIDLSRDGSVYRSSPSSAKLVNISDEEQLLYLVLGEDDSIGVGPNQSYPLELYIRGLSVGELQVLYGVDWFDDTGELIMSDYLEGIVAVNAFTQLTGTLESPEGSATAQIIVIATAQPGEGFYYDDGSFGFGVEEGDVAFGEELTIESVTFPVIELTQMES